jgi:site-specific recombinase XerD
VDEELRRFDEHMEYVQGLAVKTRREHRRSVHCLLLEQFGQGPLDISAITPGDVRRFITDQSTHYSSPGSIFAVISALRGYFRFRTACGDQVQALIAVLTAPRHWRQASLPKELSSIEVQRLVDSLGREGPSISTSRCWPSRPTSVMPM